MTPSSGLSIANAKSALRRQAEQTRATRHAESGAAAARSIAEAHLPFLDSDRPLVVSGYRAIGSELDPARLLDRIHDLGHELALPVVAGRGRPLVFRRWAPGRPLRGGWRGIGEPGDDAEIVDPDVLLVPLLLVDRAGYRLGYGAGYYDMSLADLRSRQSVVAVGIGYACQVVDRLPREPHDQPVDWILTEEGPHRVSDTGGIGS